VTRSKTSSLILSVVLVSGLIWAQLFYGKPLGISVLIFALGFTFVWFLGTLWYR